MAYFIIAQGLHGCYMPDSSYHIRADTRRALKSALEWEARDIRDAGGIGMNKRAIAWLANTAWKARKSNSGEYVAPYRWQGQTHYPYALMVWPSNRADYLAAQESE